MLPGLEQGERVGVLVQDVVCFGCLLDGAREADGVLWGVVGSLVLVERVQLAARQDGQARNHSRADVVVPADLRAESQAGLG